MGTTQSKGIEAIQYIEEPKQKGRANEAKRLTKWSLRQWVKTGSLDKGIRAPGMKETVKPEAATHS